MSNDHTSLSPIAAFATDQIRAGARRDAIKEQLLAVGWSDEEVDAAYAQGCVACGVPARDGEAGAASRFATVQSVVNFFSFILLGFIVYGLINLFFGIIELAFPDIPGGVGITASETAQSVTTYQQEAAAESIRYAIAALVIALPLYWFAMRMWFRRFRANPTAREAGLTRAVTYIVLLVAAVAMVGDLVAVISAFLSGDLTIRFILKALTVIVVAGATFGFYYLERREVQYRRPVGSRVLRFFGASVVTVTVFGIITGFVLGGSPSAARAQDLDKQRANDLQNIANCVQMFAAHYRRLPASLDELQSSESSCGGSTTDPQTGIAYAYEPLSTTVNEKTLVTEGHYSLCATFAIDTIGMDPDYQAPWSEHGAGISCDTQIVSLDPQKD